MAMQTWNGTNYDTMLGSATITATTATMTLAGITSSGVTAPNLVNAITGCWICVASAPTNGGNITVEIMESGVSKKTATINSADIQLGMNYVRFATSYTFATLTASAYTARVKNTVGTSGTLRTAASGLWFQFTYDTAGALGASDDLWIGGFNDAGLTAKSITLTGTSNTWGSKATTGIGQTTQTMGAALTIGSGGSMLFDTTASCTLTLKGSIWATAGGVFDMRPGSNKSVVSTLIIDSTALGDQGIFTATTGTGGQILTTGATYDIYTTYASGTGTAADPLIVQTGWDADVGDEIVLGGGTDYSKNEVRYIKTRNSSTSFVLCTTPGGAEVALANSHTAGTYIANLTRNSIIKPLSTSLGWYGFLSSNTAGSMDYTRCEYVDNSSSKALSPAINAGTTMDGLIMYKSPISGRQCLNLGASGTEQSATRTINGVVLYDTQGGNYSGQSGIGFSGTSNKTLTNCLHFNGPASTSPGAFISLNLSSVNNTFSNCHSYGGNASNNAAGYAVGIFSSSGNTFNNCTINAARQNAVYLSTSSGNTFNSCNIGGIATNTVDIFTLSSTLNQGLFDGCTFGSTTLLSNYLNQLEGSDIAFQNMDGSTSKHRWYTNHGSAWASGTGLTDTTVRTASSLALAIKPEDATNGFLTYLKIPANPSSQAGISGYMYRNATFSSGDLVIDLFLPGTLLTATPDATYTFPTTTGSWLPFNIHAYYSSSAARYATVRITAKTATAGAYAFLDDFYDAGTSNKVAGLDLWDAGHISPIMVQYDFSVVPSAVWGYADSNTQSGTMGQRQVDAADDAELAAIK